VEAENKADCATQPTRSPRAAVIGVVCENRAKPDGNFKPNSSKEQQQKHREAIPQMSQRMGGERIRGPGSRV